MIKGILPLAVEAMDREWLASYQTQTGTTARFANSDADPYRRTLDGLVWDYFVAY